MLKKIAMVVIVGVGLSMSALAQVTPALAQVTPAVPLQGTPDVAGLLYASNFGQYQVPRGDLGQYSWKDSSHCYATTQGITFQAFSAGAPVKIVDLDNSAHTEIVTPTAVSTVGGCSVTMNPTYGHNNFYLTSGTAGLQEALNWAGSSAFVVELTPDWTTLGGTTAMISSSTLGAKSSIIDERSAINPITKPTTTFYLDGTQTSNYTPNGSFRFPFITLDQLSAGLASYVNAGGTGPVAIWVNPLATYSTSIATTIPAIPIIIHGNISTWTFLAGVTNNAIPFTIYDLYTVGNVTYAACGSNTTRSERHGGGYSGGSVVLGVGCYNHMYGVNLSGNSNTFTVSGLLFAEATTGSMQVLSGGTSAFVGMYKTNMTKSSGININMAAGGQLAFDGLLSTAAGTANIYLPTANSVSTAHSVSNSAFASGLGVLCANGVTTYVSFGQSLGAATYCTLMTTYTGPVNIMGSTGIGAATVYRCTTAGTVLPVGSLTTVSGACGASTAVGITVQ